MNAFAQTFAAVTDTLQQVARPSPSVNVTVGILDHCGQNAWLISKIGRAASNITEAAYLGSTSARYVRLDELEALEKLIASLKADAELQQIGLARLDAEMDQQFSRDESDYRDRERI